MVTTNNDAKDHRSHLIFVEKADLFHLHAKHYRQTATAAAWSNVEIRRRRKIPFDRSYCLIDYNNILIAEWDL